LETILASSTAFIDGTFVNAALPELQSAIAATTFGVQSIVVSGSIAARRIILRHWPLVTMALVSRGGLLSSL